MLHKFLEAKSDFAWLILDASHSRVLPHAAETREGSQAMPCTKESPAPNTP